MDGFYAAYVTGHAGVGVLLLAIRGTTLVGVDAGGIKYDGQITPTERGYHCTVLYIVPPGASLITGSPPPTDFQRIPVEFDLPKDFTHGQIVPIVTPLGPVNAKFEKLKDF
jgi:hypothetical protein